jgi:abortive infection bacteriophage resistance protein
MLYAKPYLSVADQVRLLERRGMVIADRPKTEEYLRRIGYYRLSAYWYPFRERRQDPSGKFLIGDNFKPGTDFKTVVNLYAFDKALRLTCNRFQRGTESRARTS